MTRHKETPSLSKKPPVYVLYILSALTFFLVWYFFLFCLVFRDNKRHKRSDHVSLLGRKGDNRSNNDDGKCKASVASTRDGGCGQRNRGVRQRAGSTVLASEKVWKQARAVVKLWVMFDIAEVILWGATFAYILMGERCPNGQYEGWCVPIILVPLHVEAYILFRCTAYNMSTGAACGLAVAFSVSAFFGIKDLHVSRMFRWTQT